LDFGVEHDVDFEHLAEFVTKVIELNSNWFICITPAMYG